MVPDRTEVAKKTEVETAQWFELIEPLRLEGKDAIYEDLRNTFLFKGGGPSLPRLAKMLGHRAKDWPCWKHEKHRQNSIAKLSSSFDGLDPVRDQKQITELCQNWLTNYFTLAFPEKPQKDAEEDAEQLEFDPHEDLSTKPLATKTRPSKHNGKSID